MIDFIVEFYSYIFGDDPMVFIKDVGLLLLCLTPLALLALSVIFRGGE